MAVTTSAIGFALLGLGLAGGGYAGYEALRTKGIREKKGLETEERERAEAERKELARIEGLPEEARAKALEEMKRKRRIIALRGGKTLLAEEPTDEGRATLLGE